MTWPWVWLRKRRQILEAAENALRHELAVTKTNVGRARQVSQEIRAAAAAREAGGTARGG